jgi:hypothetical protein
MKEGLSRLNLHRICTTEYAPILIYRILALSEIAPGRRDPGGEVEIQNSLVGQPRTDRLIVEIG